MRSLLKGGANLGRHLFKQFHFVTKHGKRTLTAKQKVLDLNKGTAYCKNSGARAYTSGSIVIKENKCGVYFGAAFISLFPLKCNVYSRAAFNRVKMVAELNSVEFNRRH